MIAEAGLIDRSLRHRPAPIGRAPRVPMLINELGFKGLFTAEGETWRRQRRLVMRALTPEAVRGFFPIIKPSRAASSSAGGPPPWPAARRTSRAT